MGRPKTKLGTWSVQDAGFQTKFPLMKWSDMTKILSEAEINGTAPTAFEPDGFLENLERVKKWEKMPLRLAMKREKYLNIRLGTFRRITGKWRDHLGRPLDSLISCWVWGWDPEKDPNAILSPTE